MARDVLVGPGMSTKGVEVGAPLWARAVPLAYVIVMTACVPGIEKGRPIVVAFLLLALVVGYATSFTLPLLFDTRAVRLEARNAQLAIDGEVVEVHEAKVEAGEDGAGHLHVVTRAGAARRFRLRSPSQALRVVAALPLAVDPSSR